MAQFTLTTPSNKVYHSVCTLTTPSKAVHDFISRYTVFAYYGYIFAAVASLFLHLAWALAPEIWQGYSREFWALFGAGGLTALAGFITEIGRRKFTE